jgi:transposase
MTDALSDRLVPDELWEIVEPLLPLFNLGPQGGGTVPLPERDVFTAIVYVLTTGCAWRHLPEQFGVSAPTAHRRFMAWTLDGVWQRLHAAVLDRLGEQGRVDWSAALLDAASVRAKRGDRLPAQTRRTEANAGRNCT